MYLQVPSLLITDDDRDFRETLRGVFEPRGFRTLLAGNGQEALEIVQREPVHLLLLDMHMPRLTGLETMRRAKALREVLPCILISGNLDEQTIEAAKQAEAFSILSKPVSFSEITWTVDAALRLAYGWPSSS